MQEYTPATLAAYLRRTPTQAMREAIEAYEQGHITVGELESKLLMQVQRERDGHTTTDQPIAAASEPD